MRNSKNMCIVALLGVVGMAGLAQGQVVVNPASGLAKATAGNGSGSNQQTSTNTAGFNLSASKSFTNGSASAHTLWGLSSWKLSGSWNIASGAASQGEAGSAETEVHLTLNAAEDLDIEYQGGYSANSPFASITQELRNSSNNYVLGGNSPNQVHIPAGTYSWTADSYLGYGDASGGYELQFRPGNDRCQFARLVGNGTFTGDTTYATADGTPSCGNNTSANSVWYKYVAPKTGSLRIDTCGSFFDTVLSVYQTSSCPSGTGTEVGCNDDAPGGLGCGLRQSLLTLSVTQGLTYYIRVAGYNGAAGQYELNVGPVNDDCDNATQVGTGAYPFDNTMASTDGPTLNTCSNGGNDTQVNGDLWWVYTPNQNGYLSVDTCGSAFDTKIAVYQNGPCVGHSVYLACNDDSCGLQSRIDDLPVQAGVAYYVRVGGYLTNRGTGTLHVNFHGPCPADFDGDGTVDFFDYDAFVTCFEGGPCPPGKTADFDGDGSVDFFDYDAFVVAFETPCP